MTGLACLFGLHLPETVAFVAYSGGVLVRVVRVRCAHCQAPIAEEVVPVAELPESDD